MALSALTLEASDYSTARCSQAEATTIAFTRMCRLTRPHLFRDPAHLRRNPMAIGFRTVQRSYAGRRRFDRIHDRQVFIYDVSQLGGMLPDRQLYCAGRRAAGTSVVYQRDWLKLSKRAPDKTVQGGAVIHDQARPAKPGTSVSRATISAIHCYKGR